MSEFTNHQSEKIEKLLLVFYAILHKNEAAIAIKSNQEVIDSVTPHDIIAMVDLLVKENIPMSDLKMGINKMLNVLFKPIMVYPYTAPAKGTYLDCCLENNKLLDKKLKEIKPLLIACNKDTDNKEIKNQLISEFSYISSFEKYYTIKENILFPALEEAWPDFRCLGVMWSFHDDIRRNTKEIIEILSSETLDNKRFNNILGSIYYNMYAVMNREERLLFPYIEQTITEDKLQALFKESLEMGFPFYNPKINIEIKSENMNMQAGDIHLKSGNMTAEQIIMVFNHLPVDITFVDENNKVRFYSTPAHRIFPRSNAIIGRDVHNCHPPESVHVVEEIVENFRNGTKDKASFWIQMKGQFILIQYFALHDENGTYKGVIEVSQEISEIRSLEGERRLLDWEI